MVDELLNAQSIANKVRFTEDKLRVNFDSLEYSNQRFSDLMGRNYLSITKELTPSIYRTLSQTCKKLKIPINAVEAYVFSSSEIQAECFSIDSGSCVLRFSSTLIELLDYDELSFVIGHELGHFLLKHGILNLNFGNDSVEHFMIQRAQEISVDRIGFLATGSIDIAIRALMKTVSGLPAKYLRFDISNFLSQLKSVDNKFGPNSGYDTHPSIIIRCRALLWFSTEVKTLDDLDLIHEGIISSLDIKIKNDLAKYIDGPTRQIIEEKRLNHAMWTFISKIIADNKFDKLHQKKFEMEFGIEKLEKMKNLLDSISVSELKELVEIKVHKSRNEV